MVHPLSFWVQLCRLLMDVPFFRLPVSWPNIHKRSIEKLLRIWRFGRLDGLRVLLKESVSSPDTADRLLMTPASTLFGSTNHCRNAAQEIERNSAVPLYLESMLCSATAAMDPRTYRPSFFTSAVGLGVYYESIDPQTIPAKTIRACPRVFERALDVISKS